MTNEEKQVWTSTFSIRYEKTKDAKISASAARKAVTALTEYAWEPNVVPKVASLDAGWVEYYELAMAKRIAGYV